MEFASLSCGEGLGRGGAIPKIHTSRGNIFNNQIK
jgi:hypothetical protein